MTRLLRRLTPSQLTPNKVAPTAFFCAALFVAVILAVPYLPGKLEYDDLCGEYSEPRILETVKVDGFYRSRVYSYEARKFFGKDGFRFVEGPYPGQPERFRRFSISPHGKVIEVEIPAPTSQIEVRDELWETTSGVISFSQNGLPKIK